MQYEVSNFSESSGQEAILEFD